MAWLKLDDGFVEHEKVARLSDRAFRVHVAALCYCARNLTDGRLNDRAVNVVLAIVGTRSRAVVKELVSSALWRTESDGFSINDYLDYNPSADKVKEERTKAAERMRRIRSGERSGEPTPNVRGPRPVPSTPSKEVAVPAGPDPASQDAAAALDDDECDELTRLLDALAIPATLRTRALIEPGRALACARYTVEQRGNGGYFRTVFESGDTPTLSAEVGARAHDSGLRFARAVEALIRSGASRERVEDWLLDQTTTLQDEQRRVVVAAHLALVDERTER